MREKVVHDDPLHIHMVEWEGPEGTGGDRRNLLTLNTVWVP